MLAAFYERRGDARDVLRVGELADPVPGPGEVRVRVALSGINPTDVKARARRPELPDALERPQVPHQDGVGVVDAIGEGVGDELVGSRVWLYHAAHRNPWGTAAQLSCVPAKRVVPLPDNVSDELAAGLGVPFITAHRCLTIGEPVAGRRVLVTGGGGAVGNATVQLARRWGAHVVATASTSAKADLARDAGAHVVLDYRAPTFSTELRAAAPDGIDHVVDVALVDNLDDYLDLLALHATIASYASSPIETVRLRLRELRNRNVGVQFVLVYNLTDEMLVRACDDITSALRDGALRPLPSRRLALDDIAAAHETVEAGSTGRVLIELPG